MSSDPAILCCHARRRSPAAPSRRREATAARGATLVARHACRPCDLRPLQLERVRRYHDGGALENSTVRCARHIVNGFVANSLFRQFDTHLSAKHALTINGKHCRRRTIHVRTWVVAPGPTVQRRPCRRGSACRTARDRAARGRAVRRCLTSGGGARAAPPRPPGCPARRSARRCCRHISAAVVPGSVGPYSITLLALQPSPAVVLPSSHCANPTRTMPLPHTATLQRGCTRPC